MTYRTIFSSLALTGALLASGCSQPIKPFDVKGIWQAQKGECGNYCKFMVVNDIDPQEPNKLFIIFVSIPGKEAEGYVLNRSQEQGKENEWSFDFIAGTGYLYREGQYLVSKADITYKKISTLEEAKKKAAEK